MTKLVQDLPALWHAPTTTDQKRKPLLCYVIADVQLDEVSTPSKIDIRITWRCGAMIRRQIERLNWAPRHHAPMMV